MNKENRISFKVHGRYALFSDPVTRAGGEKSTYLIPTYQALKGVVESVYWKPTIVWHIDKVRVMKPIITQTKGARPLNYGGGNDLAYYTYLQDVEYQIACHFEWNINRQDLAQDRDENKHYFIAKRMIEKGGRRDVFLGTRECQAYVEPCEFGEGKGHYDGDETVDFGLMFHGFSYPDENGCDELHARFWQAEMCGGIIDFPHSDECSITRFIKKQSTKSFTIDYNCGLVEDLVLEEGYR